MLGVFGRTYFVGLMSVWDLQPGHKCRIHLQLQFSLLPPLLTPISLNPLQEFTFCHLQENKSTKGFGWSKPILWHICFPYVFHFSMFQQRGILMKIKQMKIPRCIYLIIGLNNNYIWNVSLDFKIFQLVIWSIL